MSVIYCAQSDAWHMLDFHSFFQLMSVFHDRLDKVCHYDGSL
jgi:hypothetical protein